MSILVWANNASTTLASAISSSQTTITVTAGTGGQFPAPSAGQIGIITVEDSSGDIEIMYCTGVTGDVLTVTRAQEGTAGFAFASGSRVEMRPTAGTMGAFLQKSGGDTMNGTTTLNGVLQLNSGGSIQGGEFTGALRSGAGVTAGQITVSAGVPKSGTAVILTSSNAAGNLPTGVDFVHQNMIVFWAGALNAWPSGWVLCDGNNGTPNLKDVFIVGGGGALPTSGTYSAATGSTTPASVTSVGATLATTDLPVHYHPWDYYSSSGANVLVGVPGAGISFYTQNAGGGTRIAFGGTPNIGSPGTTQHTHSVPGSAHTHTQAIPYRAVFAIMKT